MSIGHPPAPPFTVGDLEGMPDDGRRYELIDGALVVTPAPSYAHQRSRPSQVLSALNPPHSRIRGG